MTNVVQIDDHRFEAEVEDFVDKPVAVLFYTIKGIPCQHFRPVFDKIAQTHKEHFKFVSIDCNVYTATSKEVVDNAFPSVAFFNNGKLLSVHKGASDITYFSGYVNRILSQLRKAKIQGKNH